MGFEQEPYSLTEDWAGKIGITMVVSFMIATFYESGYFFRMWKSQTLLNEKIKSQQLRSELSVLRNQISPHFLFNSLNTLTTLIDENQDRAVEFTEKLSWVYRYILQYKEAEVIDLKTELRFTQDYFFLMKMRFEDSLQLNFDIAKEYWEYRIVPLTLQMLVENAIKHNVVSKAKPLFIDIYTENGKTLIVRNNLQLKKQVKDSTGTGLKNIEKRYSYLSNSARVDVITTKDHFLVALPILNPGIKKAVEV
jgi:LytS/YehU family sensor histidine kinase